MDQYVMLPIEAIVVGDRVREDYGEIDRLASSLRKWGQLLPIIVDQEYRLCDGGRRMRAAAAAGLTEIAASVRTMTDAERRDLELEIDREHKPLLDIERSKRYIAKAKEAQQALVAEADKLSVESTVNSKGGRKPKGGVRKQDVADAAGIKLSALERAEQHVKAVDQFPDLAPLPQDTALKAARKQRMKAAPDAAEKQLEKDAKHDAARRRTAFSRGIEHLDKLVRLDAGLLAEALTKEHWDRYDEMEALTREWFAEMGRARSRGLHLVG